MSVNLDPDDPKLHLWFVIERCVAAAYLTLDDKLHGGNECRGPRSRQIGDLNLVGKTELLECPDAVPVEIDFVPL